MIIETLFVHLQPDWAGDIQMDSVLTGREIFSHVTKVCVVLARPNLLYCGAFHLTICRIFAVSLRHSLKGALWSGERRHIRKKKK